MKKIIYLILCLATFSCSNENIGNDILSNAQEKSLASDNISKEEQMELFAKSLSKAVYANQEFRSFLKKEALLKVDNDNDIFYPFSMNKKIQQRTFKDIILQYGNNKKELSSIQDSIPLLNIHIPEYGNIRTADLEISNPELPIIFENKIYLNGEIVDTLKAGEIPGFISLVVCQNNKLRKVASTRSSSVEDQYEFVSRCFDPSYNKTKANIRTRSVVEYDEYSEKYDPQKGLVPRNNIDPELIDAYNKTIKYKKGTRYVMYYGLNGIEDTPKSLRTDVSDCIFRFKISSDAFSRLKEIAEGNKKYLFSGTVSNKKNPLTDRDAILKSLMTGRAFCFVFQIQDDIKGEKIESQRIKIYAMPNKLFNLRLDEYRRHPTMFRHTKYTYTIDARQVKAKWFYPLENDQDSRFDRWDITRDPVNKIVSVTLINPDEGFTKDITEKYSVTYLTKAGVGLDLKILPKIVNIGITGNFSSENTVTKESTSKYKTTEHNEFIDKFDFNYFDDYPIEDVTSNGFVIPIRKGKGIIETSILPISNKFYTIGIRQ